MRSPFLVVSLALTALLAPRLAAAGRDVDFLYVQPLLGTETLRLRIGSADNAMTRIMDEQLTSSSLSLGVAVGFRIHALRLALLVQRGQHDTGVAGDQAQSNKIFGEIGLHAWLSQRIALSPHLAFGRASLRSDTMRGGNDVNGVAAKVGLSLELYPTPGLSFVGRLDADLQTYRGSRVAALAYGFTLALGAGVHF